MQDNATTIPNFKENGTLSPARGELKAFCDILKLGKGRDQKFKSAKVWPLTIEGGGGVGQSQILVYIYSFQ